MKGTCLPVLCCDPAVAAGDALCCQPCTLQAMHTPCATLTRCCCPAILTTRSRSHPAQSPPLPSHCYFFGCFLPFCSPACNPKLLLRSPARQDPRQFTGAPAPRKDGEPTPESARAAKGGGNQSHAPPPRPSPGRNSQALNEQSAQERTGNTDTPKSRRYIPVSFPSYILSKDEGAGKSVSFPVAFIPQGNREGGKKRRRFCDVFRNQLKQTGKSPLI